MRIVCDSHIPFIKGALEPYAEVVYASGHEITHEMVRHAHALIVRTRTKCNAELLQDSEVRFIATATIGYDHIDTQWCESHGISWCNAPGCNSSSVQQYMASLLVSMISEFKLTPRELTLGVVGAGNVGSKVARMAALLGFNLLICDPPRAASEQRSDFVSIEEIIERSDIITCHVPLTTSGCYATHHLFDANRIASMNSSQILINTSRGEVVDSLSLKQALKSGSIRAAALDVWENEPDIDTELLNLLFIGTPHIAGYSADGKATGTAICIQQCAEFFNLPCRDWQPEQIAPPSQPLTFQIDATNKTPYQILSEAISYTYNIKQDDIALREETAQFEHIRSHYPVRREFQAYTVNLINDNSGRAGAFLREIGFRA